MVTSLEWATPAPVGKNQVASCWSQLSLTLTKGRSTLVTEYFTFIIASNGAELDGNSSVIQEVLGEIHECYFVSVLKVYGGEEFLLEWLKDVYDDGGDLCALRVWFGHLCLQRSSYIFMLFLL